MDINKINNVLFKLIIHNIKQYAIINKKKINKNKYYYNIKLNNSILNNMDIYIKKKKDNLLHSFFKDNNFIKLINNSEVHIYTFDINISFIKLCTDIILFDELYGYNDEYTSIFSDIINIKNINNINNFDSILKLFFKQIDKSIIPNYVDEIDIILILKWDEYFKSICFKTKSSYYLIEMLI
jgi:hypothetical protein